MSTIVTVQHLTKNIDEEEKTGRKLLSWYSEDIVLPKEIVEALNSGDFDTVADWLDMNFCNEECVHGLRNFGEYSRDSKNVHGFKIIFAENKQIIYSCYETG